MKVRMIFKLVTGTNLCNDRYIWETQYDREKHKFPVFYDFQAINVQEEVYMRSSSV